MLGEDGLEFSGNPTTQGPVGHWEDFSFHMDGNGEPRNGFEQKRDNFKSSHSRHCVENRH